MSYVYEITCSITGKKYIGSRIATKDVDILKEYFTSSKVVKLMMKDNGIESFTVTKITLFDTNEECVSYEDLLLRSVPKEERSNYLNQNFSAGGASIKNNTHTCITNGSGEFRYYPKDVPLPTGWKVEWPFKPPSQKGKIKVIDPETEDVKVVDVNKVPLGYVSIFEYRKELKDKTPKKNIWITNNISNKKIYEWDEVPPGWRLGKTVKNNGLHGRKKGCVGSTTGKIAINDGTSRRFIDPQCEIPKGWSRGGLYAQSRRNDNNKS